MRPYLIPLMLSVAAAACAGTATYAYEDPYYGYAEPDLVYAEPGVQVIPNYNEPVFYADNYYWRYNNNNWYRSNYYNRGWVASRPTVAVGRIHSPYRYRHYNPPGYVSHRGYGYRGHGGYYRGDRYRGHSGYYRGDRYRGRH